MLRPEHRNLSRLRFLDLDDEVSRIEYLRRVGHDLATRFPILGVVVAGAGARALFEEDALPALHELPSGRRQQRNAVFLLLDLLGDADDHPR
ncbi:hypothetical protein D3C83_107010 [compost metagenome]